MKDLIAEVQCIYNSSRFTSYLQGIPVTLPTGEILDLKIESSQRSLRPKGLRFSKFAFMTEVSAGFHRGIGFGEAPTKLLALQKSIAEGVERALFKSLKGTDFGTLNSNGWATHTNTSLAFESAVDELIERDAILVHWLNKIPMKEIPPSTWPLSIQSWAREELPFSPNFNRLRILVSDTGFKPTITAILMNNYGNGVISHATSNSVEQALYKALTESCRIAQIAAESTSMKSSVSLEDESGSSAFAAATPEDHAMFYAFQKRIPSWLFGTPVDWKSAKQTWLKEIKKFTSSRFSELKPIFHQITDGPLITGFATSERVQSLYFGRTKDAIKAGQINIGRMKAFGQTGEFNLMPHCIP